MLSDLRFALRSLAKSPGFTSVAILTLALGIGVCTSMFSIVNAVVLRPLPYDHPEQLVQLWEDPGATGVGRNSVSGGVFDDWRTRSKSFQQLAALWRVEGNLTGSGQPQRLVGAQVSASFFDLLRVKVALGRTFLPEEELLGHGDVVILSYAFWQDRFGGAPQLIGRSIALSGKRYAVIGILPRDFRFPWREAQYWIPFAWGTEDWQRSRSENRLEVFGRLEPTVSRAQAWADLKTIVARMKPDYPIYKKGWGVALRSLHESLTGDVGPPLFMLMGAVGFVLLIACANVANLVLARGAARQREFAVRAALGASRGRIMSGVMIENMVLAVGGGILGVLVAAWGTRLLVGLSPQDLPRVQEIGIDGSVLAFSFTLSLATGLLCGLVPAFNLSRTELQSTLRAGGLGSSGLLPRRVVGGLVAVEVAVASLLLVGAGLFLGSFHRLFSVNPGFAPAHVLTMQVSLPTAKYATGEGRARFFQAALERIEALPGVNAAGVCTSLPLVSSQDLGLKVRGRPNSEFFGADYDFVTPHYFQAMGIPLRGGRFLTADDRVRAAEPVVVSESLARRCPPGTNPIGQHITPGFGPDFEIVGVVGDLHEQSLAARPALHLYRPMTAADSQNFNLFVGAGGNPGALAGAVRDAILALDPDQPVANVRTMRDILIAAVSNESFLMILSGGFAGMALLIAFLGVYGVVAYGVNRRTREIGIRLALGAQHADVVRLVLRQGMTMVWVGLAGGLAGILMLTHLLGSLLYGIQPNDPITITAMMLMLTAAALLACWLPTRRAIRVDPVEALRAE